MLGLSHTASDPDIVLWEQINPFRRLVLANNVNEYFTILDRQTALAWMMLKGLIGKLEEKDFDTALEEHISDVRAQRGSSKNPAVIFEAQGEIETNFDGPGKELDRLEIRWDVFDKDKVRATHTQEVSASLAAVRISAGNDCRFESLGDGAYLIKPDGQIVHSITAKMGTLNAYVSRRLDESAIDHVRTFVTSILQQPGICKVTELFSMALEQQHDRYQGFVTAWAALEILTGKLFRQYEKALIDKFTAISDAPGLKGYLNRVEEVMHGRYTLVDRFSVLSIFLGGESADEDITKFKKCKETRDKLFHGKQIPDESLPLEDVCGLLDKYLNSFLESNA